MSINEKDFEKISTHTLSTMLADPEFDGDQKLMIMLIGSLLLKRLHKALFEQDNSVTIVNDKEEK